MAKTTKSAKPAGIQKLEPQSPARVAWEREVTDQVAALCECSNSDAQAIVEAQDNILEACWRDGESAMHTAAQIDEASAS